MGTFNTPGGERGQRVTRARAASLPVCRRLPPLAERSSADRHAELSARWLTWGATAVGTITHCGNLGWHNAPWTKFESMKHTGPRFDIKTVFPRYGHPMLEIRRSRDRLIFNMEIPTLERRHLYIETVPSYFSDYIFKFIITKFLVLKTAGLISLVSFIFVQLLIETPNREIIKCSHHCFRVERQRGRKLLHHNASTAK